MTTLHPSARKLQPSTLQACDRSRALSGAISFPMDPLALELEGLFEDHGICSHTITDPLYLDRVVYEQRALLQSPTALQLTNRQRGVHFLFDLTVTYTLPAPTSEFAPRVIHETGSSTSTSKSTLLRSKGTPAAYLSYLQPSQRYFCNDSLMTSQNSMTATPFSRSYTRIQGAATTRLRNSSAQTHGLDRHMPPAHFATTTTAVPSLSRTTGNIRRLPFFASQLASTTSTMSLQYRLYSKPNRHGCLGSCCALLVPALQFSPALERQPAGRSHPCHLRPLSRLPTSPFFHLLFSHIHHSAHFALVHHRYQNNLHQSHRVAEHLPGVQNVTVMKFSQAAGKQRE